jgi:hypothetical protein
MSVPGSFIPWIDVDLARHADMTCGLRLPVQILIHEPRQTCPALGKDDPVDIHKALKAIAEPAEVLIVLSGVLIEGQQKLGFRITG